MQRDSIDLNLFNVGLYSNADSKDIPNEAQTEGSHNLDVETNGQLKGIPMDTTHTLLGSAGTKFGWIERNDGKWDLIYTNGTNILMIEDFYGTPVQSTLKSGYTIESIVSNNQEVHVGCGKDLDSQWIGYISHGQFGGSAPTTIQTIAANPAYPSSIHRTVATMGTSNADGEGAHPPYKSYNYRITFVYDGYQESPLGRFSVYAGTGYYAYDKITLRITLESYASLNKRITGVKLYRKEADMYYEGNDTLWGLFNFSFPKLGEYGEYKLIADLDINANAVASPITSAGWVTSGSNKYIDIEDINEPGVTYYNNVGIEEDTNYVLASYGLNYGLSTIASNMQFVGNPSHIQLDDEETSHMIFRSKPYRYDTFDWVNDKIIMPTIPKAMKSHRGKLYVWDENTTYIIDPISFQIEKAITGRGCASQESVVETDYGLFWANKNGVYWSTQTEELIQPTKDNLTEPIKSQYQTAVSGYTPKLNYNSKRNQLLVHIDNDVFAYNTVEKRWDYYDTFASTIGIFTGKDGETYTSTSSSGILKNFGSTIRKSWIFISKNFTGDDPSQDKKFYKLIRESAGAVTVYYSLDGGSTWTSASESIGVQRGKTISIKIIGTGVGATLDYLSILFRRLRGKR